MSRKCTWPPHRLLRLAVDAIVLINARLDVSRRHKLIERLVPLTELTPFAHRPSDSFNNFSLSRGATTTYILSLAALISYVPNKMAAVALLRLQFSMELPRYYIRFNEVRSPIVMQIYECFC